MATPVSGAQGAPATSGPTATTAIQSQNLFQNAFNVLFTYMSTLNSLSQSMFSGMQAQSTASQQAQLMSNSVNAVIGQVAAKNDAKATGQVPDSVIAYMRNNGVQVNGQSIDAYLSACDSKNTGTNCNLNQGQLQSVKAALDSVASNATSFVSNTQLQIQQVVQTYNSTTTMLTNLMSMLNSMLMGIAQNMGR